MLAMVIAEYSKTFVPRSTAPLTNLLVQLLRLDWAFALACTPIQIVKGYISLNTYSWYCRLVDSSRPTMYFWDACRGG